MAICNHDINDRSIIIIIMAINVDTVVSTNGPISHLPASSFAKGPSERLKCWIEAASTAGLVVGRSYPTMRAKTHYLACLLGFRTCVYT